MTEDQANLTGEQQAALAEFVAKYPAAVFVPFDKVAMGAITRRPPADGPWWTISTAGSLITACKRT